MHNALINFTRQKVFCYIHFHKRLHLQKDFMGSSLSGQLSMGSSLSEVISSCKARIRTHVGAQKGKDSISIVDKITDAQLHEFHEAFSFFDKVCSRV